MPLRQLYLRSEWRRAATESHSRPRHSADPFLRPLQIIIRVLNDNATHTAVTIGLSDANAKDNDFSVDTEIAAHRVGPLRSAPTQFLIVDEDCTSYMEKWRKALTLCHCVRTHRGDEQVKRKEKFLERWFYEYA